MVFFFFFKGKHECDSETGFCPDKCPYSNGSYPYWRIRNAVDVPFLWVISGLKFYDTAASNKPLNVDPRKGYASSYFGPGKKKKILVFIFARLITSCVTRVMWHDMSWQARYLTSLFTCLPYQRTKFVSEKALARTNCLNLFHKAKSWAFYVWA